MTDAELDELASAPGLVALVRWLTPCPCCDSGYTDAPCDCGTPDKALNLDSVLAWSTSFQALIVEVRRLRAEIARTDLISFENHVQCCDEHARQQRVAEREACLDAILHWNEFKPLSDLIELIERGEHLKGGNDAE